MIKLRLEGVSVRRAGGAAALEGVDLEVHAGEVLVVVGPSGAGKTTLLRVMNELEPATAGRVLLDGVPTSALAPAELRRRVGLVPQVPRPLARDVAGELAFGPRLRGEAPGRADLARGLEEVGLPAGFLGRPMGRLSIGEQQRVAFARAWLNRPEVLLLDEPTSALDPKAAEALLALIGRLARTPPAPAVVLVTHTLAQARALGDRVALLEGGRLVEVAPAAAFFEAPREAATRRFLGGA